MSTKVVGSEWSVEVPPRFEVKGELGRGGMAVVFHAYDKVGERDVALKFLPPSDDEQLKKRFQREAADLAVVFHPNVVDFYSLGESGGQEFIEMEYVGGGTLGSFLRGCESLKQTLNIYAQIFDGLQHIHDNGLVHRDMKPANVLMAEGDIPKIADLGLARQQEGRTQLTQDGTVLGTAAYLAPEQLRSHAVDHKADLYALGCCLFEAVTSSKPFQANTPLALMRAHFEEKPPAPSELLPGLPERLDEIVLALMRKNPEKRPVDAQTVAQELRDIASNLTPDQDKLAASSPSALLARVQHYLNQGQSESAMRVLDQLEPEADEQLELATRVARARALSMARHPDALTNSREVVKECRTANDMKLLGPALVSLGAASSHAQSWDAALSALQEARGLVPSNDHGLQVQLLDALADVYESGPQADDPESQEKAQQFRKIAVGLSKRSDSIQSRSLLKEQPAKTEVKPSSNSGKTNLLSSISSKLPAESKGSLPLIATLSALFVLCGGVFLALRWWNNRPARVNIGSEPPGAAVKIDDQRYYTPLSMELPKGEHTLKIFKQGYKAHEEVITLEAGGNFQLKVPLESASGQVKFVTKPEGAMVYIDDQEKGKGPLELKGLPPRTYKVKVTNKGFIDYEGKVEVVAGQTRNLSVSLKKVPPPPPARSTYYPRSQTRYSAPRSSSSPRRRSPSPRRRSGKGDGYYKNKLFKVKNPF